MLAKAADMMKEAASDFGSAMARSRARGSIGNDFDSANMRMMEKAGPKEPQGPQGKRIPNSELQGPPPKRGNAPVGNDGQPVERHHTDQTPNGVKDEMTREEHRGGDNFRRNHSNTGQEPSQIDRKQWKQENRDYWRDEWDSGRFDDIMQK